MIDPATCIPPGLHPKYRYTRIDGVLRRAHRVAYEREHGPIPEFDEDGSRIVVRHKCDNKGCRNPDHLELGTQADNVTDMMTRGGYVHHNAEKAKCDHGHDFDEANTYVNRHGHRQCRKCRAVWARADRIKKKAAA